MSTTTTVEVWRPPRRAFTTTASARRSKAAINLIVAPEGHHTIVSMHERKCGGNNNNNNKGMAATPSCFHDNSISTAQQGCRPPHRRTRGSPYQHEEIGDRTSSAIASGEGTLLGVRSPGIACKTARSNGQIFE